MVVRSPPCALHIDDVRARSECNIDVNLTTNANARQSALCYEAVLHLKGGPTPLHLAGMTRAHKCGLAHRPRVHAEAPASSAASHCRRRAQPMHGKGACLRFA